MAELISTPCHSRATSYLSYEELEDRLSIFDWWEALTPTRKKNAAILAASALDSVPFSGRKLLIGQRMEFPRDKHHTLNLSYPFLKQESNVTGTGYTVDVSVNTVSFYLPVFPTSLSITYVIGGVTYTAVMADDGSISGTNCTGTANKNTAYVELSFTTPLDAGTTVDYTVSGYSRTVLSSDSLKFDTNVFGNDFLKYGAVRILDDSGDYLHDIVGNNPFSGEITISPEIETLPGSNSATTVIGPVPDDVKIAQLIQMVFIITGDAVFPQEGLRLIKIGDTMVSFSENTAGYSRYVRMASRFGLHPAAFTRLIQYSIYGQSVSIVRA